MYHNKAPQKFKEIRDNSDVNMKKVINKLTDLMQTTKFETSLTSDPNVNHDKLSNIIEIALKEIPTKKIKISKYNTKNSPWITQGLLNSIRRRDILYRQFVKTNPESPSYMRKKASWATSAATSGLPSIR